MSHDRARVALVQRFVPHYNLVFYKRLLDSSRHDWEFLYGTHPGSGESGLATDSLKVLPTRVIHNREIGKAVWQSGVTRWLRQQRYQVVIFELGWQIVSNPLLVRVAHRGGAAVIPWTKGIAENGRPRPRWRQLAERAFIRECDAILVYGQVSAEYFKAHAFPAERIFVAQNTVDVRGIVQGIPVARAAAAKLRARLGLENRVVIGYFGRLVPQKRIELIVDAFVHARREGTEASLVIAGDGPERAALERQAKASVVGDDIHFCGQVPEADGPAYFQMFDAFVSASSGGLAILEAMAHMNVVVIVAERRPETELVRDGVTGIVARECSIGALAEAIARAVRAVRQRNTIGRQAQETVLGEATTENMVDAFDRAISYALETRTRR